MKVSRMEEMFFSNGRGLGTLNSVAGSFRVEGFRIQACVAHYSTRSLLVLGGRDSVSGLVLPLLSVAYHSICSSSNMAPIDNLN